MRKSHHNFMEAIAWLKAGYKVTRTDKIFKKHYDYITLGIDNEFNPHQLCFFKDDKWIREAELWIEDYIANDWRIYWRKK